MVLPTATHALLHHYSSLQRFTTHSTSGDQDQIPGRATKGPASHSHRPSKLLPTGSLQATFPSHRHHRFYKSRVSRSVRPPPHALPVRGHPQPGQAPCEDKTMPTSRQGDGHLAVCPAPPPFLGAGARCCQASPPVMEVPLPSWVCAWRGGVLMVPAGSPRGMMLGQTSWRRNKPPHGAGMLCARTTICPSAGCPLRSPGRGEGGSVPCRGTGTRVTRGLPSEDGGCAAGLAWGLGMALCATGEGGRTPPSCCTKGQRRDNGTHEQAPPLPAGSLGGPPGKGNVGGAGGKEGG